MAAGQKAVIASAVPATRTRAGHNAADLHPKGKPPARQAAQKVQGIPKADAHKGQGPVHAVVQVTRKAFSDLAAREKGLIGEHMVDYHELKRLGGSWPHDKPTGPWSPEAIQKINSDKRPVNLRLADLPRVTQPGLDAVWKHHEKYTVTEAKFSASIGVAYGMGKKRVSSGKLGKPTGLNPSLELLFYLLSDNADKRITGSPMVQMSEDWVVDRGRTEGLDARASAALKARQNDRRVLLVTFESKGAVEHGEALVDIHMGLSDDNVRPHTEHGITNEWSASDIDSVVTAREKAFKAQNAAADRSSTLADEEQKSVKTKKSKPKK